MDRANLPAGYVAKEREVARFIDENRDKLPSVEGQVSQDEVRRGYELAVGCIEAGGLSIISDSSDPTDYTVSYVVEKGVENPDAHAAAWSELVRDCRATFEAPVARAAASSERASKEEQFVSIVEDCALELGVSLPDNFKGVSDVEKIPSSDWKEIYQCGAKR